MDQFFSRNLVQPKGTGSCRSPSSDDQQPETRLETSSVVKENEGSDLGDLDRLTMELLLNKTHYAKYLYRTDRQKYDEYKHFRENLLEHRDLILDFTRRLISDPKMPNVTEEMTTAFQTYAQTVLRFVQLSSKADEEDPSDAFF